MKRLLLALAVAAGLFPATRGAAQQRDSLAATVERLSAEVETLKGRSAAADRPLSVSTSAERRSTVAASESRCCAAPRVAGKRPAATASARRSLFMDRKDCFVAAKFERYSRISLRENT